MTYNVPHAIDILNKNAHVCFYWDTDNPVHMDALLKAADYIQPIASCIFCGVCVCFDCQALVTECLEGKFFLHDDPYISVTQLHYRGCPLEETLMQHAAEISWTNAAAAASLGNTIHFKKDNVSDPYMLGFYRSIMRKCHQ